MKDAVKASARQREMRRIQGIKIESGRDSERSWMRDQET